MRVHTSSQLMQLRQNAAFSSAPPYYTQYIMHIQGMNHTCNFMYKLQQGRVLHPQTQFRGCGVRIFFKRLIYLAKNHHRTNFVHHLSTCKEFYKNTIYDPTWQAQFDLMLPNSRFSLLHYSTHRKQLARKTSYSITNTGIYMYTTLRTCL